MVLESVKQAASMGGVQQAEPVRVTHSSGSGAAANQIEMPIPVVLGGHSGAKTGQSSDEQMSDEELARRVRGAVKQANDRIRHSGRTQCEFAYHEKTNRISIRVLDASTKEVIREIPAEETLEMVEKMWELAGILVDEKR